jgi:hypothetical protein
MFLINNEGGSHRFLKTNSAGWCASIFRLNFSKVYLILSGFFDLSD